MTDSFAIGDIPPKDNFSNSLFHIEDQKPSGTDGGGSLAITNNIRVLNTVVTNEITGASLSSNQIILPAGDYFIEARAQGYQAIEHMIKLWNDTDSSYILYGQSIYAFTTGANFNNAVLSGRFSLAAIKNLEIHHLIGNPKTVNGFGVNVGSAHVVGHETYNVVKIWKI